MKEAKRRSSREVNKGFGWGCGDGNLEHGGKQRNIRSLIASTITHNAVHSLQHASLSSMQHAYTKNARIPAILAKQKKTHNSRKVSRILEYEQTNITATVPAGRFMRENKLREQERCEKKNSF